MMEDGTKLLCSVWVAEYSQGVGTMMDPANGQTIF